ncbi:MAG: hypothetical protein DRJ18_02360, partial [Candidatus Methanomethylicota archaeon]
MLHEDLAVMPTNSGATYETIRGGTWLFLSNIVAMLSGFVFWFAITRVVGVWSVGVASAVVSASSIAVTLVSAGLNIAVMREVAAKGTESLLSAMVLASLLGFLAALLTMPLTGALGYRNYAPLASLLALAMCLNVSALFSLIGFEKFKGFFTASLTGSLAKLSLGILLSILGFKALAPLIGYLAFPLASTFTALAFLISQMRGGAKFKLNSLFSILKLSLANYPYMFSNQLLTMLSIYVFSFLIGEAFQTGILYITLMITLAIAGIPNALLSAALPIGTRRNTNPFTESFRIGLALATLAIVTVMSAPETILKIINPELVGGANALKTLLLSITPLTALTTAIMKLNRERKTGKIALIGLARLATLITLLPILSKTLGVNGATIAYLASSAILTPVAVKINPEILKPLTTLWTL